jgi:hypothetical protein
MTVGEDRVTHKAGPYGDGGGWSSGVGALAGIK